MSLFDGFQTTSLFSILMEYIADQNRQMNGLGTARNKVAVIEAKQMIRTAINSEIQLVETVSQVEIHLQLAI